MKESRRVSERRSLCACTNVQETYTYNSRLQPVMLQVGTSGNNYQCLVYNYYPSVGNPTSCAFPSLGTYNNGNVVGVYDLDNNSSSMIHTESYAYDIVNRLSSAQATGSSTYNLNFSYDPFGNMTCVQNGGTQGLCPRGNRGQTFTRLFSGRRRRYWTAVGFRTKKPLKRFVCLNV